MQYIYLPWAEFKQLRRSSLSVLAFLVLLNVLEELL
jgi:hypothetical protein